MDRTSKYRRIVIKAGSNVLTRDDGRPDTTRISSLVDQIARLHRAGIEVILVSSGAVASGRSVLEQRTGRIDTVSARQLFHGSLNHFFRFCQKLLIYSLF